MTDYYAGGYRVIRDGVPMLVFHKSDPAARKEIEFALEAGLPLTLGRFTFVPEGDLLAKATAYRAAYAAPPKTTTDYYKGGVRRIIGGVPCRLARSGKYHLSHWADNGPHGDWAARAEEFRAKLAGKGSYLSAGVLSPAMKKAA